MRGTSAIASLALPVLAIISAPIHAAPAVQTYVIAVGGQATLIPPFGCSTGGPPAASNSIFSGGSVAVPTEGLGPCGVGGGFNQQTATTGPLTDSTALTTSFNGGANSFSGGASATAQQGKVGAKAQATTSGDVNGFIYYGAEAQAISRETYSFTHPTIPNGTPGTMAMRFTVDGHLTASGPGTSIIDVAYQKDGGPSFTLMRASVDPRLGPFITSAVPGPGIAGFTIIDLPGFESISGSGEFSTFLFDFVYGTPFELAFGIRSLVSPAIGSFEVDFANTVLLTGIDVFTAGQRVFDFIVTSGSGTRYGPNGVQFDNGGGGTDVPEPATALLLLGALIGCAAPRRRTG